MTETKPTWLPRVRQFFQATFTNRLLLAVLGVSLIPLVVSGQHHVLRGLPIAGPGPAGETGGDSEIKAGHVVDFFHSVRDQVLTFAECGMTLQAMRDFREALPTIATAMAEPTPDAARCGKPPVKRPGLEDMRRRVRAYYENDFLRSYARRRALRGTDQTEVAQRRTIGRSHWTKRRSISNTTTLARTPARRARRAQPEAAPDQSRYRAIYERFHPISRAFLQRYGFYDVFLVGHRLRDESSIRRARRSTLARPSRTARLRRRALAARSSRPLRRLEGLQGIRGLRALLALRGTSGRLRVVADLRRGQEDRRRHRPAADQTARRTHGPAHRIGEHGRGLPGRAGQIVPHELAVSGIVGRDHDDHQSGREGRYGSRALGTQRGHHRRRGEVKDYRGVDVLSSFMPVTVYQPDQHGVAPVVWVQIAKIDWQELQRPVRDRHFFGPRVCHLRLARAVDLLPLRQAVHAGGEPASRPGQWHRGKHAVAGQRFGRALVRQPAAQRQRGRNNGPGERRVVRCGTGQRRRPRRWPPAWST